MGGTSSRPELELRLSSKTLTPIASLHAGLADLDGRAIRGVITIIWPYSSIKRSIAFLVAEPDCRLRHHGGQIRVEFSGPSADAVHQSSLGGGDEIRLALDGAEWTKVEPKNQLKGSEVDWQLKFAGRALLLVESDEWRTPKLISVDGSEPKSRRSVSGPPPAPIEDLQPEAQLATPAVLLNEATHDSPMVPPATQEVQTIDDGLHEYSSPAFLKRARLSYGSLFDGGLDIFDDDSETPGRGRKRLRSNLENKPWRYSSQSPGSEKDETARLESTQPLASADAVPSFTPSHDEQAATSLDGGRDDRQPPAIILSDQRESIISSSSETISISRTEDTFAIKVTVMHETINLTSGLVADHANDPYATSEDDPMGQVIDSALLPDPPSSTILPEAGEAEAQHASSSDRAEYSENSVLLPPRTTLGNATKSTGFPDHAARSSDPDLPHGPIPTMSPYPDFGIQPVPSAPGSNGDLPLEVSEERPDETVFEPFAQSPLRLDNITISGPLGSGLGEPYHDPDADVEEAEMPDRIRYDRSDVDSEGGDYDMRRYADIQDDEEGNQTPGMYTDDDVDADYEDEEEVEDEPESEDEDEEHMQQNESHSNRVGPHREGLVLDRNQRVISMDGYGLRTTAGQAAKSTPEVIVLSSNSSDASDSEAEDEPSTGVEHPQHPHQVSAASGVEARRPFSQAHHESEHIDRSRSLDGSDVDGTREGLHHNPEPFTGQENDKTVPAPDNWHAPASVDEDNDGEASFAEDQDTMRNVSSDFVSSSHRDPREEDMSGGNGEEQGADGDAGAPGLNRLTAAKPQSPPPSQVPFGSPLGSAVEEDDEFITIDMPAATSPSSKAAYNLAGLAHHSGPPSPVLVTVEPLEDAEMTSNSEQQSDVEMEVQDEAGRTDLTFGELIPEAQVRSVSAVSGLVFSPPNEQKVASPGPTADTLGSDTRGADFPTSDDRRQSGSIESSRGQIVDFLAEPVLVSQPEEPAVSEAGRTESAVAELGGDDHSSSPFSSVASRAFDDSQSDLPTIVDLPPEGAVPAVEAEVMNAQEPTDTASASWPAALPDTPHDAGSPEHDEATMELAPSEADEDDEGHAASSPVACTVVDDEGDHGPEEKPRRQKVVVTIKSLKKKRGDPSISDEPQGDPSIHFALEAQANHVAQSAGPAKVPRQRRTTVSSREPSPCSVVSAHTRSHGAVVEGASTTAEPEGLQPSPDVEAKAEDEGRDQNRDRDRDQTLPITELKMQLLKDLRTTLGDLTALKSLRQQQGKPVDVLAVATSTPAPARRPRHGPRDFVLHLGLTDPSTAPKDVVAVRLLRPHLDSLPVVGGGDVVLLRAVVVRALPARGFGLHATDESSWAVFERGRDDGLPQIRGPPVEVSVDEAAHAAALARWYGLLDERALERLEIASAVAAASTAAAASGDGGDGGI